MIKSIGFPISHKENENRRALLPDDVAKLRHPEMTFFEYNYGELFGYSDSDYIAFGANVVSREKVLAQNIICDPKIGDAEYLDMLHEQTIFGWIHAVQNRDITDKMVNNKLSGYAWEDMFEDGRHIFWRNNELAGEAAVLHAYQCYGKMPYETKAAVIGRGNTARGVIKILNMLGADVVQYDRRTEGLLRKELGVFDVVVNCVLWDVSRNDHIIFADDLKRMKKGAMIIDVSCDRNGGIESSIPTTIEQPTYYVSGIMHYCVDHTPSIFFKTFTKNNSEVIYKYIDMLINDETDDVLKSSLIIDHGTILNEQIKEYQHRP